ncbi:MULTISPECIES: TetR/AcrR family transcriptional regulator [Streptomyces]|uniref:TetR/AcrR family transcriptional regulator n=1 Tax=Streptomyces flaveolus TaxID=67297 RepID=A0ABV3AQ94_9ACTN|nr:MULTISPECIES: TetR/AcrR family transcriptional regulator [Streptomyces]
MRTFWAQGYEGTSVSDLTTAMGMTAPSVYAAFGDKETLFRKAVERYLAGHGGYLKPALEEPTASRLMHTLLRSAIDVVSGDHTPHGCLTVQGALAVNPRSLATREFLNTIRVSGVEPLTERLRTFQQNGDLPPDSDPSALARLLLTVIHGLAVQAASGVPREMLEVVADEVVACWLRSKT